MRKSNRVVLALVCLIAMAGVFSTAAAAEKVTLELTVWGSAANIPVRDAIIEAFEKTHPNIEIEVMHIPDRYMDKLQTMIAGGTAPDVFWLNPPDVPAFAEKKVLLDLTSLMAEDEEFAARKDNYFAAGLDGYKYGGGIYGLPWIYNPEALFYNKKLFDEAGLDYPDKSWGQEEFLEAAQKLTKDFNDDGRIDQWGYAQPSHWTFVWRAGGEIYDDPNNPSECLLDSPEAIAGLQFLQDLIYKYKVTPTPVVTKAFPADAMFMTGKLAMITGGAWMTRKFQQASFPWGTTSMPAWKERVNMAWFSGISAYAKTDHPEEAWEFIKFYAGPTAQKIILDGDMATIPVLELEDPVELDESVQGVLEAAEAGRTEPAIVEMGKFYEIVNTQLEYLWLGELPAEDVAKAMADKINDLIQK